MGETALKVISKNCNISLFAGCEGFGSVGLSSGEVKNSQIAASSSRKETFLSYSGRIGDSFTGWIPKKRSKREFHTLHFFQVDLKLVAGIKMVRY